MSNNILLDIQTEIIKRLPALSLVRFRLVSKPWKSLIDSSNFINSYHLLHTKPQHHLLVKYKVIFEHKYVSIADDDTFPQHKSSLTVPPSVNLLQQVRLLCSSHGLICFYGFNKESWLMDKARAVIWNPSVRKCIDVVVPRVLYMPTGFTVVGFGVCPDTGDSKLVKVNTLKDPSTEDRRSNLWEVEVFTLSSRVWKTVSIDPPLKPCDLTFRNVCIKGFIYWLAFDDMMKPYGCATKMIISYDLTNEVFGEVSLPDCLVNTITLSVHNRDECLALLECHREDEIKVCGIWMMKDGVTGSCTKMFTVEVPGRYDRVSEFRKNGETIREINRKNGETIREMTNDTRIVSNRLEVYDPCSQRINDIGMSGNYFSFAVSSYVETLLLLDCTDSIIRVAR